jgi:hypothetical protein
MIAGIYTPPQIAVEQARDLSGLPPAPTQPVQTTQSTVQSTQLAQPKQPVQTTQLAQPTGTQMISSATTGETGVSAEETKSAQMLTTIIDSQKEQQNQYMDKLSTMTFAYDPLSDPEYKLAASQMEQQVSGMMIGRGMLYSSVTTAAVQSGLTSLMSTYRKQAYDMYSEDRNFTLQMAQLLYDRQDKEFQKALDIYSAQTDRENTAWDQNYKLAQFAFTQKQTQFENQLATAKFNADRQDAANSLAIRRQELAISQANANYNRQLAEAKQKQADNQNKLLVMQGEYSQIASEYEKMLTKWENDGYADAEVSAFFGGNLQFIPFDSAITDNYINQVNAVLARKEAEILNYAKQTNDGELYLNALSSFQEQSNDPQVLVAQQQNNYNSAYNLALNMYGSTIGGTKETMTWKDVYNSFANNSTLLSDLGSSNYNKLITQLADKVEKEIG